jgi:DNA-binding winged helix-turn-helix (wHTH) protein
VTSLQSCSTLVRTRYRPLSALSSIRAFTDLKFPLEKSSVNNDQSMQHFGDFALTPDPPTLRRGFEVLKLPHRQMEVLRLLVEAQGSAVPKTVFFEQIWSGSFVEEGNLTQTIFLLRRALGRLPDGGEYIETLPRLGYRIAPVAFTLSQPAAPVVRKPSASSRAAAQPHAALSTEGAPYPNSVISTGGEAKRSRSGEIPAFLPAASENEDTQTLHALIAARLRSRWEPIFWIGVGMIVSLFAVLVALFSLAYVNSINNQPAQEKSFVTPPVSTRSFFN